MRIVNELYLLIVNMTDDFAASNAINEISVQECKLDFGPV